MANIAQPNEYFTSVKIPVDATVAWSTAQKIGLLQLQYDLNFNSASLKGKTGRALRFKDEACQARTNHSETPQIFNRLTFPGLFFEGNTNIAKQIIDQMALIIPQQVKYLLDLESQYLNEGNFGRISLPYPPNISPPSHNSPILESAGRETARNINEEYTYPRDQKSNQSTQEFERASFSHSFKERAIGKVPVQKLHDSDLERGNIQKTNYQYQPAFQHPSQHQSQINGGQQLFTKNHARYGRHRPEEHVYRPQTQFQQQNSVSQKDIMRSSSISAGMVKSQLSERQHYLYPSAASNSQESELQVRSHRNSVSHLDADRYLPPVQSNSAVPMRPLPSLVHELSSKTFNTGRYPTEPSNGAHPSVHSDETAHMNYGRDWRPLAKYSRGVLGSSGRISPGFQKRAKARYDPLVRPLDGYRDGQRLTGNDMYRSGFNRGDMNSTAEDTGRKPATAPNEYSAPSLGRAQKQDLTAWRSASVEG